MPGLKCFYFTFELEVFQSDSTFLPLNGATTKCISVDLQWMHHELGNAWLICIREDKFGSDGRIIRRAIQVLRIYVTGVKASVNYAPMYDN